MLDLTYLNTGFLYYFFRVCIVSGTLSVEDLEMIKICIKGFEIDIKN